MRRVHIFILFQLAVFHPIFEQLRLSPEFFLAHQNQPLDIIMLLLFFWLVLPLMLIAGLYLVSRYSPKAAERMHLGVFALLLLSVVLFALNRTTALPPAFTSLVAFLLTGAITAGYIHYGSIRSFITFLFPIVFVAPALFLSNHFIQKLIRSHPPIVQEIAVQNRIPVVLVIFDELPLSSLLDERKEIDSVRFPGFAKLAHESYWFRNASTVGGFTSEAVPAILTGRYPEKGKVPMFFDHPRNLFVMLSSSHRIVSWETATRLCPGSICKSRAPQFEARFRLLLSDIFILYTHLVLPPDWADRFFPIEDVVNFLKSPEDRAADFTEFSSRIVPASELPPLYFVHVQLPHSPWRYLPSGETMNDEMLENLKRRVSEYFPERVTELFSLECHLLQVGFVDTLLTEFMDRLKRADLYAPSLIIVTSDHGLIRSVGQNPQGPLPAGSASGRETSDRALWENALVPLFIKLPHQKNGVLSDRNVEAIDILPTIADVLGTRVEWSEGISALDESQPERPHKFIFEGDRLIRMDAHLTVNQGILKNKLFLDDIPLEDFRSFR